MTVKSDIKLHVGDWPGLVAKISNRLYPLTLPQEPTLPAVTYFILAGTRDFAHDGDLGFSQFRIQFDSYGSTPEEVEQVINEVISALAAWHSTDPKYTVFPNTPQDFPEPELSRFRMTMDAMVSHKE